MLVAGTPLAAPLVFRGTRLWVDPIAALNVTSSSFEVRVPLPGIPRHASPIALQFVWMSPPGAPCPRTLAASNALTMDP